MINSIKIKNFKSIENMDLIFEKNINNIIGKNGIGKTNILLSISYLYGNNFLNLKTEDILKINSTNIYLNSEYTDNYGNFNTLTFSFDKNLDKKIITLNGKKVTKKTLFENIPKISCFFPFLMNLFYLGPKYRRDFLDDILKICNPNYSTLLSNYEKITKNRNKLLKNINEGFSKPSEMNFWNDEFIKYAKEIYKIKLPLINFIKSNIHNYSHLFKGKFKNIEFEYISKTDLDNIESSIKNYLEKNLERDIILGKTHIGPHIDDFNILLDNKEIINFASRGETKTIIIILKLLEIEYIKLQTGKTPILLIDDLISELDEEHINLILNSFGNLQIICTSIDELKTQNSNIIII